jgi:hypothetical protein
VPVAVDAQEHFINVPNIPWLRPAVLQAPGVLAPELQAPSSYAPIAEYNPSLKHHLLDVPKREAEAVVKPDAIADHPSWEPMALLEGGVHKELTLT